MIERSFAAFVLLLLGLAFHLLPSESACPRVCDLALGAYYVTPQVNLSYIAPLFGVPDYNDLIPYNRDIKNPNSILSGSRVHVYFSCDCINGDFLGHNFSYVVVKGDTYDTIAKQVYANLTTAASLAHFNSFPETNVPVGATIGVIVNCSCGDEAVSKDYGLFETYPLLPGENLSSVAAAYNFSSQEDLLQRYNPGADFNAGTGVVFIPTKDPSDSYRPLSQRRNETKNRVELGQLLYGVYPMLDAKAHNRSI
ncbi:hypothetical protein Cni_G12483 [Canna indica]|uniref:Chitin elicitor receptor kinase 1 n=1 Tax=Canna indica TaxID=4628 RepID=A0AAQ3QC66_9LILI|nr:hypothetical protein Cni_G12483 [Canna indica]